MNAREKLREVEKVILELQQPGLGSDVASTLRKLVSAYDGKASALTTLAEEARAASDAFRAAVSAFESGLHEEEPITGSVVMSSSVSRRVIRFGEKPAWECAQFVLREAGKELSADEIARRVTELGKDLGEQHASAITNGLKRYIDRGELFYRIEDKRPYLYGLAEWKQQNEGDDA